MNQYYPPNDPRNNMMGPPRSNPGFDPMQSGWRPYEAPPPAPMPIPVQGRWVTSPDEILPKEVPMDNQLYLFPQEDYQCIYGKIWTKNGQLMTFRFLPEKNETPATTQNQSPDISQTLNGFANAIDQRLATFEQRMNEALRTLQPAQEPTLAAQMPVPKRKTKTTEGGTES